MVVAEEEKHHLLQLFELAHWEWHDKHFDV